MGEFLSGLAPRLYSQRRPRRRNQAARAMESDRKETEKQGRKTQPWCVNSTLVCGESVHNLNRQDGAAHTLNLTKMTTTKTKTSTLFRGKFPQDNCRTSRTQIKYSKYKKLAT